MINERDLLARVAAARPEELLEIVRSADTDESRTLSIYFGPEQFAELRTMAAAALTSRGAAVNRGNVVVLHGILGSELSLYNNDGHDLIWVNILNLLGGQFDRLTVDEDTGLSVRDIRSTGMYMRYYGKQLAFLSQEWTVRPFFYDWRRDIRDSADQLRTSIDTWFGPAAPVHLIAHSMGGLVSRSFIARHQDRWQTMLDPDGGKKGGRLVFLGTPNHGSFAVPRLLSGINDVLDVLTRIDVAHGFNRDALIDVIKTFTGVYHMMPVLGRIAGLEPLYLAATYRRRPVRQAHLDETLRFQKEIKNIVDPNRMVYVAGYNRRTAAGLADAAHIDADAGYSFSMRGDGTVPHDLGLLDGVRTFYVDEEHSGLPQNRRVLAAMAELLETGNQQNENNLFFGLADNIRGVTRSAAEEPQAVAVAAETSRRELKQRQADELRQSLQGRGAVDPQTVTPEEQALADLLMKHEPLRTIPNLLDVGGDGTPVAPAAPVTQPPAPDVAPPVISVTVAPPATKIRIFVQECEIQDVPVKIAADASPVDCIAVGHYMGVHPSGAEYDLDLAISGKKPRQSTGDENEGDGEQDLLITQFHDRGILRGELGEPFFMPDPRPGHEGGLVVLAGMGAPGTFGVPELTCLARELCWSAAQLNRRHIATVLIGGSKNNLSIADAVHGFLIGLQRALAPSAATGGKVLDSVTFAMRAKSAEVARRVLYREAKELQRTLNFTLDLSAVPEPPKATVPEPDARPAATRITIDFDGSAYRFSALTENASIAERLVAVNPKRVTEVNDRLVSERDSARRAELGRFLLKFLFPRDLSAQLTGAAPIVLTCNNAAAQVHWEMAAQVIDEQDSPDSSDTQFLSLMRGLTRQLKTTLAPPPEPPPPFGRTLRVLLVADTCKEHPLIGAQREAQALKELFDEYNKLGGPNRIAYTMLVGPAQATPIDVLLKLEQNPPFDVLHYAGHCFYDKVNPGNSGYLFSGGDVLTAGDLDRIDRTPKFVFSNACESGVVPSRLDKRSPELAPAFAESFFNKGVSNFVCTAWPVQDDAALAFAKALYSALLGFDGSPAFMWAAMRTARNKIADTMTWGAYQHYGNPYFRLFRSTKERARTAGQ